MAIERRPTRQLVILVGLLVALAALLAYNLNGSEPAANGPPASNPQRNTARTGPAERTPAEELDVRIEALEASKPDPEVADRNPFRFRPPPPPPPPPPGPKTEPVVPEGPPPGPPPPPPITLKFIGVVESPRAGRIAALSDGKVVIYGREGEIVEGRYRIVKIGAESIVIEYADGQGRQTIRLSGQ